MNEQRKPEIEKRSRVWLILMIVVGAALVYKLFSMQILEYDRYQKRVIDNVQKYNVVQADRGNIYDRNMVPLATNATVYRIFIDPSEIKKKGDDKTVDLISTGLSDILGVDYDTIYSRAIKEKRADETIKKKVSEADADLVRKFIDDNGFSRMIYLEATSMRYYPYGSLAANVIGVVGTDEGLLGIEKQFNSYLQGTPGHYITTRGGDGSAMPSEYSSYVDAKDGCSVVTTLDITLQSMLEENLKSAWENANPSNRVTGILMDPDTGAIRAMAVYPNFDLNDPYTLDETSKKLLAKCEYDKDSDEYNEYMWELIYGMWNNKAVSDLYEPGSTMKIVSTSMALDLKVVKFTDTFNCSGSLTVSGTKIGCHKKSGHGKHEFSYLLQQSCNPAMMQVAAKIGERNFYQYFLAYGFAEKTGIDLPGEANGIYVSLSGFNTVELACYSFGQTFKTTAIRQLSAVAAIANGGYIVTPHVVERLTDADGSTVQDFNYGYSRQIVSKGVCAMLREVLEDGVSGDGGARNAYVAGYKIAAKTGTSEKRDTINPETGLKDLRVASCVAMAPSDDPVIVAIIIVDEPHTTTVYGSALAAPYMASLMSEVLPYLGVQRNYTEEEMSKIAVKVKNYSGTAIDKAKQAVMDAGMSCTVIGTGDKVVKQVPAAGEYMTNIGGKIFLYTDLHTASTPVTVPNVVTKASNAAVAISMLQSAGFNVYIEGATNFSEGTGASVIAQSPAAGTLLERGDVVTIECRYLDVTDD